MFDKIDVCESVSMTSVDGANEPEEQNSFNSVRSRYRYADQEWIHASFRYNR